MCAPMPDALRVLVLVAAHPKLRSLPTPQLSYYSAFINCHATVPKDENGLSVSKSNQINIVKYHRMIGHSSCDITKKAARLGINF
jgi:hypothetical protein